MKGQEVLPEDHDLGWPNSEFRIVRTLRGDYLIATHITGELLEPEFSVDASALSEEHIWGEREELVETELERFVNSLRKR